MKRRRLACPLTDAKRLEVYKLEKWKSHKSSHAIHLSVEDPWDISETAWKILWVLLRWGVSPACFTSRFLGGGRNGSRNTEIFKSRGEETPECEPRLPAVTHGDTLGSTGAALEMNSSLLSGSHWLYIKIPSLPERRVGRIQSMVCMCPVEAQRWTLTTPPPSQPDSDLNCKLCWR